MAQPAGRELAGDHRGVTSILLEQRPDGILQEVREPPIHRDWDY
jgi:hypothetical protein